MKTLILVLIFAFIFNANAQEEKNSSNFFSDTALQIGYLKSDNTKIYLGFDKYILKTFTKTFTNLGFGAFISHNQNKLEINPEIHLNTDLAYVMTELSFTNKSFNPSVGLNIYNSLKLKWGYNIPFNSNDFKGNTFAMNINFGDFLYYESKKEAIYTKGEKLKKENFFSHFFDTSSLQIGYTKFENTKVYIGFDNRIESKILNQYRYIENRNFFDRPYDFKNIGFGMFISEDAERKKEINPEIHINACLLLLMTELSFTNKSFNPSIGLNIQNAIKLKWGYCFPYNSNNFKGSTFGIHVNLGNKNYYDEKLGPLKLKMMP